MNIQVDVMYNITLKFKIDTDEQQPNFARAPFHFLTNTIDANLFDEEGKMHGI